MVKAIVVSVMCLCCATSYAETLKVQLDCKGGVCTPAKQDAKVDVGKLRKQVALVKAKLDKIDQAIGTVDDVFVLKEEVKKIKSDLAEVKKFLDLVTNETVNLISDIKNLREDIEKLDTQMVIIAVTIIEKIKSMEMETNARFENAKNNLQIGAYGILSHPFGHTVGASLTLDSPMGSKGLWRTHLTGGLGKTKNVGFLTSLSLERKLHRNVDLGPAVVYFGDIKDVKENRFLWVAAGGASLRLKWKDFNFVTFPFLGVGTIERVLVNPRTAIYEQTPCGLVIKQSKLSQETVKTFGLQGGVLFALTYSLF